jgi:hypothetical protein
MFWILGGFATIFYRRNVNTGLEKISAAEMLFRIMVCTDGKALVEFYV